MKVFTGKVVWITGASSGIGEALAHSWADVGARVILTARREDRLHAIAHQINQKKPDHAQVLAADLMQIEALPSLAEKAISFFGKVDVLFNNAGASQRGFAVETPLSVERKLIELDLISPIAITKAILPHFIQRGEGRIVVTSSLMGELELPGNATYACVKHGINGYFLSLAFELKNLNIPVHVLMPGFVKTEISMSALTPTGQHGKMDSTHQNAMSPEAFAQKALSQIAAGKPVIVIGGIERFALWVRRLTPGLYRFAVKRFAKNYLKDRIGKTNL